MRKPSTTALRRREKLQGEQLTIGLDLGDRSSFYCVLNGAGEVILEAKVATNLQPCGRRLKRCHRVELLWKRARIHHG